MTWPETRANDHEDDFWDEETGEWTAVQVESGGRYKTTLVIIGQNDNGEGVIYYSESS